MASKNVPRFLGESPATPAALADAYPIPDFLSRPRRCSFVEMMTNQAQTPVKSPVVKFQLSWSCFNIIAACWTFLGTLS